MDDKQRGRWDFEKQILKRHLRKFAFRRTLDGAQITGWVRTTARGKYKLQLEIPTQFPHAKPRLYVVKPRILWTHGRGERLNDMKTGSARFHTNAPTRDRFVEICYLRGWDATWTWLRIIARGTLWCEAYAAHLRTGEDLARFLPAARGSPGRRPS